MKEAAYYAKILRVACEECKAPSGMPCVALRNGRNHKRGQVIVVYHVKRVLKAHPSREPQNCEGSKDG